jgi:hypothetical protein
VCNVKAHANSIAAGKPVGKLDEAHYYKNLHRVSNIEELN